MTESRIVRGLLLAITVLAMLAAIIWAIISQAHMEDRVIMQDFRETLAEVRE